MKKLFALGLGLLALGLTTEPTHAASLTDLIPENPQQAGLDDIEDILIFIIQWALGFSAAIGALFVLISGYQYVLAAGNPEKLEKAKMGLTWSITGFILAISAYSIVLLLQTALRSKQKVDTISNKIEGPESAGSVLAGMIELVLVFAGATAIIFLMLGGYRYITSQGNRDLAEKAKQTILYAVIGLIVTMVSALIFSVVTDAINVRPKFL